MPAARAALESLLRARKLDLTITGEPTRDAARLAPTGWPALDEPLGGGLPRGHLSEIIGARSSGR
jgi:RecA/RadA recombinase